MKALIIIIVIIVLIVLYAIHVNNLLIKNKTDVDNAWSQIDVQFQRRNDLIPNLVNTVKGYAHFEQSTLENVIKMRGQMIHLDPNTSGKSLTRAQMMNLSNQLSRALKSIFAVSERYPQLQANDDFKDLMNQLTNTENKVAFARQNYNNCVTTFNQNIQVFPKNIIANSKHYTQIQYLKASSQASNAPKVNFNN